MGALSTTAGFDNPARLPRGAPLLNQSETGHGPETRSSSGPTTQSWISTARLEVRQRHKLRAMTLLEHRHNAFSCLVAGAFLLGGCALKTSPSPPSVSARLQFVEGSWIEVRVRGEDAAAKAVCEAEAGREAQRMPGSVKVLRACEAAPLPPVRTEGVVLVQEALPVADLLLPHGPEARITTFSPFPDAEACAEALAQLQARLSAAEDAALGAQAELLGEALASARRSETEACRAAADAPACEEQQEVSAAVEKACAQGKGGERCTRAKERAFALNTREMQRDLLERECSEAKRRAAAIAKRTPERAAASAVNARCEAGWR